MRKMPHRGMMLLAFALGVAACEGRSPSAPTTPPSAPPGAASAPTVTSISPSTGSTVRDTPVTISGTGFVAGTTVRVNVAAVGVTLVNSRTISAIVPAHAAGQADVVVTNPGGSNATLPAAFTYSVDEPFTVTASTNVVEAGGEMSVSWTAPAGRAGDWIAVCRVGGGYEDDWYVETLGATSGTQPVTAPPRPGQYEFRYLLDNSGLRTAARSSPVTVR